MKLVEILIVVPDHEEEALDNEIREFFAPHYALYSWSSMPATPNYVEWYQKEYLGEDETSEV